MRKQSDKSRIEDILQDKWAHLFRALLVLKEGCCSRVEYVKMIQPDILCKPWLNSDF